MATQIAVSTEQFELAERLNETRQGPETQSVTATAPAEATDAEDANVSEDLRQYPKGLERILLGISIGLGLILVGLDGTIVATAVPSITDHFHTVADIGWYSSAYYITLCAFQFMFGKMYKILSRKGVFLVSTLVFEIGSVVCGTASSSAIFVLGRAIAGLGSAGIISGCFSILMNVFPLRQRPLVNSIAGSVEILSIMGAPVLGGILTQSLSWRWCFFINIPLGAFTLAIVAIFFKDTREVQTPTTLKQKLASLDLLGTAIFFPCIVCFFLALQWGGTKYGWSDPRIIVAFVLSATLLSAFIWTQHIRQDDATLPPRIFRQRSILAGFWYTLCTGAAMNVIDYYLPTYLQAVKEFTPAKSGVLLIPGIGGFMAAMIFSGSATTLIGYYTPMMIAASVLMPIATGLLTTLKVNAGLGPIIGYQFFLGLASGLGFQAPQIAAQTALPEDDAQIGIAINLFAASFGSAISVQAGQTLFTNRLLADLRTYAPDIDATALAKMGLSDIKGHVPAADLPGVLLGYDKAIMQTFYLGVGLSCFMIIGSLSMEWKSVKERRD